MSIVSSDHAKFIYHYAVALTDLSICNASNMICKLFKKLHHATLSIDFLRRIYARVYNASSDIFYKKIRNVFFHIEKSYVYIEKLTGSIHEDDIAFLQFWRRKVPFYSSREIRLV